MTAPNASYTSGCDSSRIRVAVIYGGRSTEHSISCISAAAMVKNLDPTRYDVTMVGIDRSGRWMVGADPTTLEVVDGRLPEVVETEEIELSASPAHRGEFHYVTGSHSGELFATVDVAFPVLHGRFGEDGTIQGLFELSGLPYVGVGVTGSAMGMNKHITKTIAHHVGVAVVKDVVLAGRRELTESEKKELGLPVFVKPNRGGSSIGISRVTSWDDFPNALERAYSQDSVVIVEPEIIGSEIECGVLEYPDGALVAAPPARLLGIENSQEGFYGFDTKYRVDCVSGEIPAAISEEKIQEIQDCAMRVFRALGCSGLSRVDFFLTPDGLFLNEINTLPGFTPISMYPQVFAAQGIPYDELLRILISTGLARGAR